MKEEIQRYLAKHPEAAERARQFFDSVDEPDGELEDLVAASQAEAARRMESP